MKKLFILSFLGIYVYATPVILEVKDKVITVNGKQAKVYTIEQPDGTWGYFAKSGDTFDVTLKNKISEPTVIHWHGLLLPNNQDGVTLTQNAIESGASYHYQFKLKQSGTYWMHSHYVLQEQMFAEAPLIIDDGKYPNQAIIMFQDFSFKNPDEILSDLKKDAKSNMAKMDMSKMNMADNSMPGMNMSATKAKKNTGQMKQQAADLNDVKYDAFLTNYATPRNPKIVYFKPGDEVRLRFINGASATNFWIKLGKLKGTLIAVDGENVKPVTGREFPLAMAQRMDVIIHLPKVKGVFPILGQVEGLKSQTGMVISTDYGVKKYRIKPKAQKFAPALNYDTELKLSSLNQLTPKKIDQVIQVDLDGDMQNYQWTINTQAWPNVTPIIIKRGSRVEMDITNKSMMMHPIHLHGNVFEMVSIDGVPIPGALRDTLFILPGSHLKIIFDANEPGKWLLHCHMLYHMHSGMMTYVEVK